MLASLKRFLESTLTPAPGSEDGGASREHRLALATTALMLQISAIDQDEDARETEAILNAASRLTTFTESERHALLELARERVGDATSLYEFTGVINDLCRHEERLDIVEQLWRVALADDHVDSLEEHLIRRVADLFHLTPSEFVQCRHRAQD
jgi:uncharacterized tellurite resistance protein B-like protein